MEMTLKKAPGKNTRKGIRMIQALGMLPDDSAAEDWFIRVRWADGPQCPHYGAGSHRVQSGAKHKTMPFRWRDCRKRFSLRIGTVMQDSTLGYQVWAMAIYLFMASLKSVSSTKLHGEVNIAQNSVSEYVRGQAHTNGVEAFWSMLQPGYRGTFRKFSPKHLDRCVQEFAGRCKLREQDTIDMTGAVVLGMDGKRLKYDDLIRDSGLGSGVPG